MPATVLRLAVVLVALAGALLPLSPHVIERVYSSRLYPMWQSLATSLSNLIPIALLDVLIVSLGGAWAIALLLDVARRRSRGWTRIIVRAAVRTVVWGAACYIVFLASWGLNYRRVRLAETLGFDGSRVSADALKALTATTIDRINTLHEAAHRAGFPAERAIDPRLAAAFADALREVGSPMAAVPARPKFTLLNPYFRRATVDGMTDPYFLETLVVSDLLDIERPFVMAHEWAHLAGYADEGEANFVGWVTCLRGDAPHQYSGWLFLYSEAAATLPAADRRELGSRVQEGPRADLRAISDRVLRNRSPRVAAVGWRVYNEYLKANRIESGVASYTEVVKLILGTRFNPR